MSNQSQLLRISDYPIDPIETFDPSEPASRLVGNLKETGAYEGFVEEKNRTYSVGMRDILDVDNVVTTKLSTLMSPVPRLNFGDSANFAAKLMFEHRIKSLPVYEKGKLLGKITSISLTKAFVESIGFKFSLSKIMTPDPITVESSDSAAKARSVMMRRKIDQLPIVEINKLAGAVTSSSIVFSMLLPVVERENKGSQRKGRFANTVISLADEETTTNDVRDSLSKVLENMLKLSTNYSVILDDGQVKGIVTFRDFLKIVPFKETSEPEPVTIIGLPDNPLEAELVKSKFTAAVQQLRMMDPKVTDVRAVIKNKMINSQKMLYQVQVFVDSIEWHESYKAEGYDISQVFSEINTWIKRIASKHDTKPDRVKKKTSRRYQPPDELNPE